MNAYIARVFYIGCFIFLTALPVFADTTKPSCESIRDFIAAFEKARMPEATAEDIERYLSFMADDVSDYHAVYGVTIDGKDRPRKGMLEKARERISFGVEIEDTIIGTMTAIIVLNEDSKYYKDKKLKHFKGRTILILEFNEQGLIQNIRRYLD